MPINTSNPEPVSFVAGDTAKWTRKLDAYSASAGWALNYELVNAQHRYEIAAVADGGAFRMLIAA